jgi:hypothetical protein
MLTRGGGEEVGDPVDDLESPRRRTRVVKPEQRDHPVHVDQEQRSFHTGLLPLTGVW